MHTYIHTHIHTFNCISFKSMLTAAKSSFTIVVSLPGQSILIIISDGQVFIRKLPTTVLQMFKSNINYICDARDFTHTV